MGKSKTSGEEMMRLNITVPKQIGTEIKASGANLSAIATAAYTKHLADKVYIDAAKEVICRSISSMEKRLEAHGVLGPDDRLDFAKIRAVIFAVEGDAWIKRSKIEEIKAMTKEPDNGTEAKA